MFSKRFTPNLSEEVFVVIGVKNAAPYMNEDLNGDEITGTLDKRILQKIQLKKKNNKLNFKCKFCNNFFNSSIDKSYIARK